MKYIITETQYKLLTEQFEDKSSLRDPSKTESYPRCVGIETSNKNRGELKRSKSGQYYIEIYIMGLSGFKFYNTGRVMYPDGKMGNYSCKGRDILVDGKNIALEKWQKEKPKTTNWEKQELKKAETILNNLDPHTIATIFAIGTAFIPVVGPFISAGIGLADAALYYKEGDSKSAGLTAAFSMIPFAGKIISKIPGVKQLGSKGMALLASKLSSGAKNLTKAETEIANAISKYSPEVQQELSKMAPKLKNVMKEVEVFKPNFIKKYGEREYNSLLTSYLYDGIEKQAFIGKLKNVKAPTIKVKPVLGGGADHRVFQSSVNPNVVFKAEMRAGEVNKWYDTFKKYPKIFAKPFRKVKVRGDNGELLEAVAMEKLDTSKFMTLWDTMSSKLGEFQKNLGPSQQTGLESLLKSIKGNMINDIKWKKFIPYFKKQYPNLANQVDEFAKMVEELYKITPNPDIRKFNLGYDSSGVLKALDL